MKINWQELPKIAQSGHTSLLHIQTFFEKIIITFDTFPPLVVVKNIDLVIFVSQGIATGPSRTYFSFALSSFLKTTTTKWKLFSTTIIVRET